MRFSNVQQDENATAESASARIALNAVRAKWHSDMAYGLPSAIPSGVHGGLGSEGVGVQRATVDVDGNSGKALCDGLLLRHLVECQCLQCLQPSLRNLLSPGLCPSSKFTKEFLVLRD
eukprot:1689851-Pyramimonas_sp.AAC.1